MQYRRARTQGGTYFFTVVTFRRKKILCKPENVIILRNAFKEVMKRYPFQVDVFVLLANHLHCIWTLLNGDRDFSKRWRLIKSHFTRQCDKKYKKCSRSLSRSKKKEQSIWQRRFWEHLIRDEKDFVKHVDYIHYNPVKHGLVMAPKDWEYSIFHRYVRNGVYDREWGMGQEMQFKSTIGRE